jgi:hypothetical protein
MSTSSFPIIIVRVPVAQIREAGEARAEHGLEGFTILACQRKVEFEVVLDLLKR